MISNGVGAGAPPNLFSGFSLVSGGSGIWSGSNLRFTCEKLRITANAGPAWASVPSDASYPVRFNQCELASNDAGVNAFQALLRFNDCDWLQQGRQAIRLIGCSADVLNPFVASIMPNDRSVCFLESKPEDYGSRIMVVGGELDNEGGHVYRTAPIVAWQREGARPSHVTVDNMYAAAAASNQETKVGVRLFSPSGANSRATYNVPHTSIWEDDADDVLADDGWEMS